MTTTSPVFKDYETILSDMLVDLASKGTRITDLNAGSIVRTLLEIAAVKFDECHYTAEQILDLFFVATTSGERLRQRFMEKGLTISDGTKATGTILGERTTPAPFSQLIYKGTIYETEDRSVQLETTEETTLLAGATSVSIPVRTVLVGTQGNLQNDTVLKQVGVAVSLIETVTVASSGTGLTGGTNAEADEELRSRYTTIIQAPGTSGNKADYTKWAMEVSGCGGVYVVSLWNGPGTVKLLLLGLDKLSAGSEVVDALQAYIDPVPGKGEGKAPIGATVTCAGADQLIITVSATVILDGSKTLAEVKTSFEASLVEYLAELAAIAFSQSTAITVRYNYIGSLLLDTPGVTDHSNLLVNDATGNISVAAGVVAVKGTVTLV